MKRLTTALLCCIFFLSACTKKNNKETGDVNIRIENATAISLEDAKVGDAAYGNVPTGTTTNYSVVTLPVYAGYCNFKMGGQQTSAGYGVCGTPPPPAFAPGYYTFKVEPVSQGYFTVVVTRD